jgi:hypothetical protein
MRSSLRKSVSSSSAHGAVLLATKSPKTTTRPEPPSARVDINAAAVTAHAVSRTLASDEQFGPAVWHLRADHRAGHPFASELQPGEDYI